MFGRHKKRAPLIMRRKGSFMLFIYLLATLVSSFLTPQTTQALPTASMPTSAIINEDLNQLYYNRMIFSGPNTVQAGDSLTNLHKNFSFQPGVIYYVYINPTDKGQTDAHLMAVNSKSNPTKGQYVKLKFNTDTKTYSDIQIIKDDITVVKGEIPTIRNCNIPWIGWIVCPLANALATALDDLYDTVTDILVISPIDTNRQFATGHDKPLYAIWSIIRGISNMVFIILFIIITLSYVTGFGLSNYTIKKIFPRLIVTAVLVNLSLTICVLLVDVFNLIGHSVADIFLKIQSSTMPDSDLMAISGVTWASLLASVYGAGSLILALNGGIVGATLLVLGGMAGALATIVAVVIALSARQALVIILTIVSPLAFVLNLLPNTEKWFEQWWKSFIKILAIFPIFALIYGASQLASSIIIQTANDSFILILVGLIVKVIPFGLLIGIIKSSDAIMDRVTNAASNSTKSIGEGAQEFLRRKQEIQKARYESGESKTPFGRFTPRGVARTFNQGRRRDEARLRAAKARQEALYAQRSSRLDVDQRPANADAREEMAARGAEAIASANKRQVDVAFNTIQAKVDRDMFQVKVKDGEVVLDKITGKPIMEFKGISHITNSIEYEVAKSSLTKQIAEREMQATTIMQQDFQTKRTIENVTVPIELGYGETDLHNAMANINTDYKDVILADVIKAQRAERQAVIASAQELLKQVNLSETDALAFVSGTDYYTNEGEKMSDINEELQKSGNIIKRTGIDGKEYVLDMRSKESAALLRWAAALRLGEAPRDDIHEYIQIATVGREVKDEHGNVLAVDATLNNFREEVVDLMLSKVGGNKMMGIKTPDYMRQDRFRGRDTYYEVASENIAKGRYSAQAIATRSKDELDTMLQGLKKMANNEYIDLANPNNDGQMRANMLENLLEQSDKKTKNPQVAYDNLVKFKKNLIKARTDPMTAHLLQDIQIQKIDAIIGTVDKIVKNKKFNGVKRK